MIKQISNYRDLFPIVITTILFFQCTSVKLKSLDSPLVLDLKNKTINTGKPEIRNTVIFFEEQFSPAGYSYAYPVKSQVSVEDSIIKSGLFSLKITLDANEYSGGAICRGQSIDLTSYRYDSALKFWIKGQAGQEITSVGIVSEQRSSKDKTVIRLPLNKSITTEWQQICIPLIDFSDHGVYWDERHLVEIPCDIDWTRISEIRFEIKKGDNQSFTIFIDDLLIEPGAIDTSKYKPVLTWDRRIETVTPHSSKPFSDIFTSIFNGSLPRGSYTYVFGRRTACVQNDNSLSKKRKILTCYLDNLDYSGVSIIINNNKGLNLKEIRKNNGGLVFEARGKITLNNISIGFLDCNKVKKKVQSRVCVNKYGEIDQQWNRFIIPLKHFSDIGYYWDQEKNEESQAQIDWTNIHEIRFSSSKNQNEAGEDTPLTLYLDDIFILKNILDTSESQKYWSSFKSSEPDLILHDFNNEDINKWSTSRGPNSQISYDIIDAPDNAPGKISKCLKITFSLQDWCDVIYSYAENRTAPSIRNWTKHWGIRFLMYTEKMFQGLTIQLADSDNELYVTNIGALQGWNDIIIPFHEFTKYFLYQPSDAIMNDKLDLDRIQSIEFKAPGNNTSGTFFIGNVRLTNERESGVSFSSK